MYIIMIPGKPAIFNYIIFSIFTPRLYYFDSLLIYLPDKIIKILDVEIGKTKLIYNLTICGKAFHNIFD